jgi:acyl carrier protein
MTKKTAADVERWLARLVGELVGVPAETIDVGARFDRYGLDSAAAISVTVELEKYLGRELEPTLVYEYPTIAKLARHLTAEAR